jgi:hypothetical protein
MPLTAVVDAVGVDDKARDGDADGDDGDDDDEQAAKIDTGERTRRSAWAAPNRRNVRRRIRETKDIVMSPWFQ